MSSCRRRFSCGTGRIELIKFEFPQCHIPLFWSGVVTGGSNIDQKDDSLGKEGVIVWERKG